MFKSTLKKIFIFLYKKIKSNRYIRSVLIDTKDKYNLKNIGIFVDSNGNKFYLLDGYRDIVQPGWQGALKVPDYKILPTDDDIHTSKQKAQKIVKQTLSQLGQFSFDVQGADILEFGCHDGIKSQLFVKQNANSVTGSDIPYYYRHDRNEDTKESKYNEQVRYLEFLRDKVKLSLNAAKDNSANVRYVNDNITESIFSSDSFDLIFSWNVFEHIQKPHNALAEIYRILKPGAITYNKYNPFFCEGGGTAYAL